MAGSKKKEKAPTITKKELIDRIAEKTESKRVVVKRIIQKFLDAIVEELGRGNRLEFRDFGVFETRLRKPRMAQNPKTLERVPVSEKRTVKFKVGRLMKQRLSSLQAAAARELAGKEPKNTREGAARETKEREPKEREPKEAAAKESHAPLDGHAVRETRGVRSPLAAAPAPGSAAAGAVAIAVASKDAETD